MKLEGKWGGGGERGVCGRGSIKFWYKVRVGMNHPWFQFFLKEKIIYPVDKVPSSGFKLLGVAHFIQF